MLAASLLINLRIPQVTARERAPPSTATIVVTASNQTYLGGNSGTTFHSGNGDVVLDGGAGNDTLIGGSGTQTFIGGPGDTITGGSGADLFVFGVKFGANTISDFDPKNDHIQLAKSEFANFNAVLADASHVGGNTVITLDLADTITLKGVSVSSLHSSDFLFA